MAATPKPARSTPKRARSTMPRDQARNRYLEIGVLAALEQIRRDAEALDAGSVAVGPFTSLDANDVAARDGKTRGVISNLFGSQAAFQAETMALALSAGDEIDEIVYPLPADFPNADEWVDAVFAGEAARGPRHGAQPSVDYASEWALWLSAVPYGLWSEQVAGPSVAENQQWMARLAVVFQEAFDHFAVSLRPGTSIGDLACAIAGIVEGLWLNQCLTSRHPTDPSEPVATAMRRSGRLLWLGATVPRT